MSGAQIIGTTRYDGMLGYMGISLSHMLSTDTAIPQILAGSKVEINGAMFTFASNESISNSLAAGEHYTYIMLTPAGSGPTQTVAASLTDSAPVWDSAKQGWYASGTSNRYIGGCYYNSGGPIYALKWLYAESDNAQLLFDNATRPIRHAIITSAWNMDTDNNLVISLSAIGLYITAAMCLSITAMIKSNAGLLSDLSATDPANLSFGGRAEMNNSFSLICERRFEALYDNTNYNAATLIATITYRV